MGLLKYRWASNPRISSVHYITKYFQTCLARISRLVSHSKIRIDTASDVSAVCKFPYEKIQIIHLLLFEFSVRFRKTIENFLFKSVFLFFCPLTEVDSGFRFTSNLFIAKHMNRLPLDKALHKPSASKGVGLLGFEPRSSAPKAPRITKLPYNPIVVLLGFEPRFPDFLTSPSLSAEVTSQGNRCHGDTDLSPSHLRPSYTASDTMRQSLGNLPAIRQDYWSQRQDLHLEPSAYRADALPD